MDTGAEGMAVTDLRSVEVGDHIVWTEPFQNGPEAGLVTSIGRGGNVYYCTTTDPRWPARENYPVYRDVNEPNHGDRRSAPAEGAGK